MLKNDISEVLRPFCLSHKDLATITHGSEMWYNGFILLSGITIERHMAAILGTHWHRKPLRVYSSYDVYCLSSSTMSEWPWQICMSSMTWIYWWQNTLIIESVVDNKRGHRIWSPNPWIRPFLYSAIWTITALNLTLCEIDAWHPPVFTTVSGPIKTPYCMLRGKRF